MESWFLAWPHRIKTGTNSSKNGVALLWSEKASSGCSAAPHLKAKARKRGNIWDLPQQSHSANKLLGASEFAQGKKNARFLPPAHCEVPVVISHEGDVPVLCFRACLITRNILHESLPDKEYKTVKSTICAEKCMSVYMCTYISAQ